MRKPEFLWRELHELAAGELDGMELDRWDARLIVREVLALQRVIREMGSGEALLVRDVREELGV